MVASCHNRSRSVEPIMGLVPGKSLNEISGFFRASRRQILDAPRMSDLDR
jgi:hypothetical protein